MKEVGKVSEEMNYKTGNYTQKSIDITCWIKVEEAASSFVQTRWAMALAAAGEQIITDS